MPQLTIVVPTFKEKDNIRPLAKAVGAVLADADWEIIFVDDNSPDGTADCIRALAQEDRRIRCMERIGRRGLSSAAIEGLLASSAPCLAVMDADLQHDESILLTMHNILKNEPVDIVVGSRYVSGGGIGQWSSTRAMASRLATRLAQNVTGIPIQDPMSGFFMMRREFFASVSPRLLGRGFKILLDILATPKNPPRFREIPFTFKSRLHGESKMSAKVVMDYFSMLAEKGIRKIFSR